MLDTRVGVRSWSKRTVYCYAYSMRVSSQYCAECNECGAQSKQKKYSYTIDKQPRVCR